MYIGRFSFLPILQAKKRADERTRTAGLISLQVIHQALQGVAQGCKCRISKPFTFLSFALCCTVLRSRRYQSGVRSPWIARLRLPEPRWSRRLYDLSRYETTRANR